MFNFIAKDLAVDLGTSNLLVYSKGEGVVYNEPCVVAADRQSGRKKIMAVGNEAKKMLGRTPDKIETIRPLRNGVIADFDSAQELLKRVIRKVNKQATLFRPRVVLCVPHAITEVEKRAVREAAFAAGAREVFLLEEPIAAAIGAGLPIAEACGSMIIDVGGGTTEIAIISMKGIVYSESLRVGGDYMDEALQGYVRRHFNMLIGEQTAEQIKLELGSVLPSGEEKVMEIRGRDLLQGVPKTAEISAVQVREALAEPVNQILGAIRLALEKIPPELASDIVDRGITMTGGGSLLRNLDLLISAKTGLPVVLVDHPLTTVVRGAGSILDHLELLNELVIR